MKFVEFEKFAKFGKFVGLHSKLIEHIRYTEVYSEKKDVSLSSAVIQGAASQNLSIDLENERNMRPVPTALCSKRRELLIPILPASTTSS